MQSTSSSKIIGKRVLLKTIDTLQNESVKLNGTFKTVKGAGKQLVIVTETSAIPLRDYKYVSNDHDKKKSIVKFVNRRIEVKDFGCQVTEDVFREEKCCQTNIEEGNETLLFNDNSDETKQITAEFIDYFNNDIPTYHKSMLDNNISNQCITEPYSNVNGSIGKTMSQISCKYNMYMYYIKCDLYDDEGYLRIHHAVEDEDVKEVKRQCVVLKLKRKTIDFETNNTFYTPLQLAILHKSSIQVIEMLLSYNSSFEPQDNEGNSIIHLAIMNCTVPMIEKILVYATDIKYDINQYNFEGLTPLMAIVIKENVDVIKLLLTFGANPNAKDQKSGKTALFYAIETNKVEIVQLLLQYGADTNITNFLGMNCRDIVFELDNVHKDIQELIKSNSNVKKYIKASNSKVQQQGQKKRRIC